MSYSFSEIIDTAVLQEVADHLFTMAGIPIGIIDVDGTVHVQAGWQSICVDFHRKNPITFKQCQESDSYIKEHLHDGGYISYKCKNNLWDIAFPIVVENQHFATLFVGQFFYEGEEPDYVYFKNQAARFGFNTAEYIDAVKKAPVFTHEKVKNIMEYYQSYVKLLVDLGLERIQLKRLNDKVQMAEEYFRHTFEHAPLGLCNADLDGCLITGNQAFCNIIDYNLAEIHKLSLIEITHLEDVQLTEDTMSRLVEGRIKTSTIKKRYIRKDGRDVWVNVTKSIMRDILGNPLFFICIIQNISEQKKTEDHIFHLSYHDPLTDLYNRRYFEEYMKNLDSKQLPISILMADANNLKLINDTLGHAMGDQLLMTVAYAFKKVCRSSDVIARLGGDEFVVVLPKTGQKEALQISSRITAQLAETKIGFFNISVSIGCGTKAIPQDSIFDSYKRAEDQMYFNKFTVKHLSRQETVSSIKMSLFDKYPEEKNHSENVARLSVMLGRAVGLSENDLLDLQTAAQLHDIGKISISSDIFKKVQPLTPAEWREIYRHSEVSYRVLGLLIDSPSVAGYVLSHHERMDGAGYPRGLKGSEIPIHSRIIAIADSYDAMTDARPYRPALSKPAALLELQTNAGTQFDPELVELFVKLMG